MDNVTPPVDESKAAGRSIYHPPGDWPLPTFLVLVISVSLALPLGAQEVRVIPDDISCPTCRVTTQMLFELGGPGDTTNIVHTNFLPMDSQGRFYFQSVYFPGNINVFNARGDHIDSFGGEGDGPGEFRSWAALFVGAGDSLYAFDSGAYRMSVFSPNHDFIRSSRIDPPIRPADGLVQSDGSILVSAVGRGPETFGYTLHVVSSTGAVQRSFGEGDTSLAGRNLQLLNRRVTASKGQSVWVSHVYRYMIERLGSTGDVVDRLERRPSWFPLVNTVPYNPENATDPPPFPIVTDIQEDDEGRLWVLIWVAAENWRAELGARDERPPRVSMRDTLIEVLDTESGTVLARTRLDELAIGFSGPGVFFTYDDRDVFDQLEVWRLSLVRDPIQER